MSAPIGSQGKSQQAAQGVALIGVLVLFGHNHPVGNGAGQVHPGRRQGEVSIVGADAHAGVVGVAQELVAGSDQRCH